MKCSFEMGVLIRQCTCAAGSRTGPGGLRALCNHSTVPPSQHHPATPVINTYKTVFTKNTTTNNLPSSDY